MKTFPLQILRVCFLLGGLVALSLGAPLKGQAILRGVIYERMADQPLPAVNIHILETTLQDMSDDRGEYLIQHIPPGTYKIRFSKEGYLPVIRVITVEKTEGAPMQVFSLGVGLSIQGPTQIGEPLQLAHGFMRRQLHSPYATEKLARWQMSLWQPVNVTEGVERLTGVSQVGGAYGLPSLSVRGLDERRIAMDWEGVQLSPSLQRWGASPVLGLLDPQALGAVSVQRGTGQIRSGIGFTAGRIHFAQPELAFSGEGVEVHGQARYLFQNPSQAHQGRLSLSLHSPKIAVRVGATGTLLEALQPGGTNQNFPANGFDRRNADAQAQIRINPRQELSLGYRIAQLNDLELQAGLRPSTRERFLDDRSHQMGFARLRTYLPEGKWVNQIDITGSYQMFEESRKASLQPGAGPDVSYPQQENSLETYGGKIELFSTVSPLWHFVSGVDAYLDQAGGQTTIYDPQTEGFANRAGQLPNGSQSSQVSLYSLHTVDILKLRLTLGGRAQADTRNLAGASAPGNNWQSLRAGWSLSGMYPLSESFQLVSTFQSGFRAPSLFELAGQGPVPTGLAIANDSLVGEQSLTSEIGLKAETERIRGEFMLYRTRVNDWIGYQPGALDGQSVVEGLPVYQAANQGQVFVSGIEASVEVPIRQGMFVYGNVTYTHGTQVANASPLTRIPPLNSRLGMYYHHRLGVWGQVEWRFADQQNRLAELDEQDPALVAMNGSWQTVDVKLGYDFRWGYASIGLLNLMDERFQQWGTDFLQPGRRLVASLQIGF